MTKSPMKAEKKNKEIEFALAYSVLSVKYHSENKALLKDLLSRGIEKSPSLILAAIGSNFWNPKEKVTMKVIREGTIRHDYEPMINAYEMYIKRGNKPVESAFLAGGYVKQDNLSLEDFEKRFNKKEKFLLELLNNSKK